MSTKLALADALANLSKEDFEKFIFGLLSRKEKPRVSRNRVEDKSRLQVTDVLVSTFTERGAVTVTADILRQIGCSEDAEELERETSGQSSKPGPSDRDAGAAGVKTTADSEHFVDQHRDDLIQKVTDIPSILDKLLQKDFISQESYDTIRAMSPPQEKMRELYKHLTTKACKDFFYEILKKHHKYLVEDLS